jgi:hypothetical protein
MNIRKTIKEEMDSFEGMRVRRTSPLNESDDFGWAKDVNFLSKEYLLGKGIEFDPWIDGDEVEYFEFVIKTLRDIGFRVGFNVSEYIYEMTEEYEEVAGLYIRPTDGRVIITGSIMEETYQEHINEYVGTQVDVVMGREIFHMSMNESMEWAKEINPTPYNGVKFISNTQRENIVYTITDNGGPHVVISWNDGDAYGTFGRGEVEEHFRKGNWSIIDDGREDEISLREDFGWTSDIPAGPDPNKKMSWREIVDFLKERFVGTRFYVDVNTYDDDDYPVIAIEDGEDGGTYDDWYAEDLTSLSVIIDRIKETCDDHGSEDIRLEYCELYDAIIGYRSDY